MIKYNQEIYKKSETTNNAGLLEIAFKDNSRFVGEFVDNAFQGKGALFIQDIGRYEGEYFDNKIIDGLFTLNGWLQYEGTFDNNERFAEGTFTIESLGLNFYIKFVQTRLFICKLYEEDGSEIELLKKPDDIHYIYKNGYHLELSPDLDAIYIYKPYDEDLYDGKRFDIDIKNNVFVQQNYLDGKETGFQKQFSLENIPYYQEYESRSSMDEMPVFKMTSVNGNSYLGRKNFQNGEVRMYNKTYFFSGGVKGPYKHGSGYLEFSDGYRQDVIYIEDKIAYKGLQEVFDFVTNFKALDVEELQIGQNINMIRFMDKVKSFDGKIDDGDTEEIATIVFKNGNKYIGRLKNFKMTGKADLITSFGKIHGEFSYNELAYGTIEFFNGAFYEGQLIEFERNGDGYMKFTNGYEFRGRFINNVIAKRGGRLYFPNSPDKKVNYVHVGDFNIGVFVLEGGELMVLDCETESVHSAKFLDELEKSGFSIKESIQESLRTVSFQDAD